MDRQMSKNCKFCSWEAKNVSIIRDQSVFSQAFYYIGSVDSVPTGKKKKRTLSSLTSFLLPH